MDQAVYQHFLILSSESIMITALSFFDIEHLHTTLETKNTLRGPIQFRNDLRSKNADSLTAFTGKYFYPVV